MLSRENDERGDNILAFGVQRGSKHGRDMDTRRGQAPGCARWLAFVMAWGNNKGTRVREEHREAFFTCMHLP